MPFSLFVNFAPFCGCINLEENPNFSSNLNLSHLMSIFLFSREKQPIGW